MKAAKEMIFNELPTANCHASTVLPLPDGSVLAAWFGGTKEGRDDVDIWVSRRCGGKWSRPACVSAAKRLPHWNPVLFLRRDGTVCLFFKVGRRISSWRTFMSLSQDGGVTFGEPKELVPGDKSGGRGPVKNKIIRLADGRLLAPASTESRGWVCFVDMSQDDGVTWQKQRRVPTQRAAAILNADNFFTTNAVAMIQPTLWQSEDGGVHMLTRTSRGLIYRSDSDDLGASWCTAYSTGLPNPNSGIDLVRAGDRGLYLVMNPVGENWGDRSPLVLMHSGDNGASWQTVMTLEPKGDEDSEFSYPAIEYLEGKLHITYTYVRQTIAYWEITL